MRNVAYGAAFQLGINAWRTGQSIKDVLDAAGYASYVVEAVTNHIRAHQSDPGEATQPDSQTLEENMSSSNKRQRTSTTTKKKIPVAPSVRKYVKKCMDRVLEDKFKEGDVGYTNVPSTGACFADTLLVANSITDSGRIGNHIRLKSFLIKGIISCNVPDVCRVILLWDKQCNGAAPAVTDILSGSGINNMYNADTVVGHGGQRFNVIFDKRYVTQPQVTTEARFIPWGYSWKGDKVITYDGTAGTIADLVSNNLVFLYISQSGAADVSGRMKVNFVDA